MNVGVMIFMFASLGALFLPHGGGGERPFWHYVAGLPLGFGTLFFIIWSWNVLALPVCTLFPLVACYAHPTGYGIAIVFGPLCFFGGLLFIGDAIKSKSRTFIWNITYLIIFGIVATLIGLTQMRAA